MGMQASGKSTFYQRTFASTHKLASKDLMSRNSGRDARFITLVTELLGRGESVCVDNCNPLREQRARVIEVAAFFNVPVLCYVFPFDVTLKGCLARNDERTGKARVPLVAIRTFRKEYVAPAWDEGYARMFDVTLTEESRTFSVTERSKP